MKIAEMTLEDLGTVAVLAAQLGYPGDVETFRRRFQAIQQEDGHKLYVAKSDTGQVVGWIHVNRESAALVADPRAEVAALVVDEKQRGLGIGKLLVRQAEAWATSQNLPLMRIRSNILRSDTHRFYEREGYAIKKSWHLFTKGLSGNAGR